MYCQEHERLTAIFLDAVDKNDEAARTVIDIKSEEWRDATKETRSICIAALTALNDHRVQHGCDEPLRGRTAWYGY